MFEQHNRNQRRRVSVGSASTRHWCPNVSYRTAAAIIAVVLAFLAIFLVLSPWHHERPRETGALVQIIVDRTLTGCRLDCRS